MDHCRRFQHNMSRKWNHQRSLARSLMHRHVVPLSTKSDTQTHTHIYSENKLMQHLRHIHTHTISHDVPLNTFCMFLTHSCVWIKPWSGHGAGEGEVKRKREDVTGCEIWKWNWFFFLLFCFFDVNENTPEFNPLECSPQGNTGWRRRTEEFHKRTKCFPKDRILLRLLRLLSFTPLTVAPFQTYPTLPPLRLSLPFFLNFPWLGRNDCGKGCSPTAFPSRKSRNK